MILTIAQSCGLKKANKSRYLTQLKQYLDWCIAYNYINYNPLDSVKYTDIDAGKLIRYETIQNIEHLKQVLDIGLPEINETSVSMNTINKLYAYLLYSGMTDQEIVDITKDEAKLDDNNILTYNGKDILIQPIVKEYLNKVINSDNEIVSMKFGRETYLKLLPSDKLIGCERSPENRINNFKHVIVRSNKEYQDKTGEYIGLSSSRIYQSGVFFRLLQKELTTGVVDEDALNEAFNIREEKYSTSLIHHSQKFNAKADYESWKRAWFMK